MNTVLLYFAIPLLVIVSSIILEKILNNPLLVTTFVFTVFLVVVFALNDTSLLVAVLAYTIIALITALTVKIIEFLTGSCNGEEEEEKNTLCDVLSEAGQNNNGGCNSTCNCNRHKRSHGCHGDGSF